MTLLSTAPTGTLPVVSVDGSSPAHMYLQILEVGETLESVSGTSCQQQKAPQSGHGRSHNKRHNVHSTSSYPVLSNPVPALRQELAMNKSTLYNECELSISFSNEDVQIFGCFKAVQMLNVDIET